MATSSSCTSRNSRRRSPPGLPFPRLWAMLVHEVFSVRDASQSLAEPLDCPNSPGARTCYDGNFSVFSAVRRLHARTR